MILCVESKKQNKTKIKDIQTHGYREQSGGLWKWQEGRQAKQVKGIKRYKLPVKKQDRNNGQQTVICN